MTQKKEQEKKPEGDPNPPPSPAPPGRDGVQTDKDALDALDEEVDGMLERNAQEFLQKKKSKGGE
jgi:hypothetical protein